VSPLAGVVVAYGCLTVAAILVVGDALRCRRRELLARRKSRSIYREFLGR
jgi:hypothetical protein